jgi:hypothetical protein
VFPATAAQVQSFTGKQGVIPLVILAGCPLAVIPAKNGLADP